MNIFRNQNDNESNKIGNRIKFHSYYFVIVLIITQVKTKTKLAQGIDSQLNIRIFLIVCSLENVLCDHHRDIPYPDQAHAQTR